MTAVHAHENPFRTERLQALRYRFEPGSSRADLIRGLRTRGYRGAIVGPKGTGKTTLVRELAEWLVAADLPVRSVRLNAAQSRFEPSMLEHSDHVLIIDGAERLSRWQRRRVLRAPLRGLIVTVHEERRAHLPVVIRTRSTREMTRRLVHELAPSTPIDAVDASLERHSGNVREALLELYDRSAAGHFRRLADRSS